MLQFLTKQQLRKYFIIVFKNWVDEVVQLLALFFENRVVLGSIPAETTPALKHAIFIFALSAHSRQEKDTKK